MINALILMMMTSQGPQLVEGFPMFFEDNKECRVAMEEVTELVEDSAPGVPFVIDCFEQQPKGEPV